MVKKLVWYLFFVCLGMAINQGNCLAACSTAGFTCWHDDNKDGIKQDSEIVTHYPTGEYGCEQASFMNVKAISNGGYTGTGCGYWQCVEFVKRFYKTVYGVEINVAVGVASNFYNQFEFLGLNKLGFARFANGGNVKPMPGDIIVFSGGSSGHVAVFVVFIDGQARIIEQNYDTNGTRDLAYSESNNTYTITGTTAYPVLGWIRFIPGRYIDGFHTNGTSQAFLDAYNKYKATIGYPYDNGGGVFVHEVKGIYDL